MDAYARAYSQSAPPAVTALIVGGRRVGRATSGALSSDGIEHRVVEREHVKVPDRARWVCGNATDSEVLDSAGLDTASSVAITMHDDDLNVYLTLYCRSKRPDIKILSRSMHQQNVATLRLAGADFVMSYVPMEANAIFDVVRHGSVLSLGEGLEVFTVRVPRYLAGQSIADCNLRRETGCNVLAVRPAGGAAAPPDILAPLLADSKWVLIGDREDDRPSSHATVRVILGLEEQAELRTERSSACSSRPRATQGPPADRRRDARRDRGHRSTGMRRVNVHR